jgi:uncharacterized protein (UPF0261 family)
VPIAIVGMLDEREEALGLIKDRIERRGHRTVLIDISIGTGAIVPALKPDVSCLDLVALAGGPAEGVREMLMDNRHEAISLMARGLTAKVAALRESGQIDGIIVISGMTGALISLPAMKTLPFGMPKILISSAVAMPIHAEQFAKYFALRDITVMHAVVDTVGMNNLVQALAINGANAISGMVERGEASPQESKPSIAITEFGFCDKGAHYIREILEENYEIVSFHATGLGDQAAMDLVPQEVFAAFIDLVPGAFSEYILGGNRGISGPDRLDIGSKMKTPYIFCPGGFDMISCGPIERKDTDDTLWKSRKLAARKLYIQESPRVQARMNAQESKYVAEAVAEKLNKCERKERVKAVVPLKGFSSISVEGAPLFDPASDEAFVSTLRYHLDPEIEFIEVASDINSREFAAVVRDALAQAFRSQT